MIRAHPDLESDQETAERRLKNVYTSYQILISVKVAFIFIQTLTYLIIYRPLGVLVVTLGDMVADVANFSVLLGVTICTFMVASTLSTPTLTLSLTLSLTLTLTLTLALTLTLTLSRWRSPGCSARVASSPSFQTACPSPISPLHLPIYLRYISPTTPSSTKAYSSPISPPHLLSISPISPLYLPYISQAWTAYASTPSTARCTG